MTNSWKNIFQIIVVIILLLIVGYLGFRLIDLNKAPTTPPPSPSTETSAVQNSQSDSLSLETENNIPVDKEKCTTDTQCTVMSISKKSLTGGIKTQIQCLNKSYLDSCTDCKSSEDLVKETASEATCSCIKNLCQFTLLTTN